MADKLILAAFLYFGIRSQIILMDFTFMESFTINTRKCCTDYDFATTAFNAKARKYRFHSCAVKWRQTTEVNSQRATLLKHKTRFYDLKTRLGSVKLLHVKEQHW